MSAGLVDRRADLTWRSLPRLAQLAGSRFADCEALVDGGRRWTFAALAAEAVGSTRAAMSAGIGPGDRVAIWAPNSATWIVAALGAQGAGAAIVPINTRFKGGEAAHVLRTSRARVLFTVTGFLGTDYPALLYDHLGDLKDLERTVILSGDVPPGCETWEMYLARGACVEAAVATTAIESVTADSVADVIFTSGTTGAS